MITDISQIAEHAAKHVGERRSSSFFRDRDAALTQPTRAKGDEPCVESGDSIDPKANWKTRDRSLCGKPNCNRRVNRRYARELEATRSGMSASTAPRTTPVVMPKIAN